MVVPRLPVPTSATRFLTAREENPTAFAGAISKLPAVMIPDVFKKFLRFMMNKIFKLTNRGDLSYYLTWH